MSASEPVTVTARILAAWLQEMGYRGKITCDGDQSVYVESASNGLSIRLFCLNRSSRYTEDADEACHAIRFQGGWDNLTGYDGAELADLCNAVNRRWQLAKAYIVGTPQNPAIRIEAEWLVADALTAETFDFATHSFTAFYDDFSADLCRVHRRDWPAISERHCRAIDALHGPEKSIDEGVALYRLNARAAYAGALNNLGDLYEEGLVVPRSDLFAVYHYARAAERAEPTAYLSLATILSASSQDREILLEAARFAILAERELPDGVNKAAAVETLRFLGQRLGENDWKEACQLAEEWRPLHHEPFRLSDKPSSEWALVQDCPTIN